MVRSDDYVDGYLYYCWVVVGERGGGNLCLHSQQPTQPTRLVGEIKKMDIGMLWFDNDKETDLQAKLLRAVDYYKTKYGLSPDLCFVHPGMLVGAAVIVVAGVEVRASSTIMPNHFWIGMRQAVTA